MRALNPEKNVLCLFFAVALCGSLLPNRLFADDKDTSSPPAKSRTAKAAAANPAAATPGEAKTGATKIDAPAPLTERERMLLDRMEHLEKRVAELEAKSNPSAAAAVAPSGTQHVPVESTISPVPAGNAVLTPAMPASSAAAMAAESSASASSANPPATVAVKQDETPAGKPAKAAPFAFADFTWLNGNARTKESPMDTKFFTPEIRADVDYNYSFNHPKDDTISGSSEVFRHGEVQVTQLGVGGDFHYDNVRARLMTQFGMYSQTTPRNDASPARGQWNLDNAYRYISEAYGGYHFDVLHGINVDAGIFMSYIGLFSYYQFDNWAYQPSFVSSNTPWFFNGVRVQIFPTEHLKIEPWFTNGWQSYGRFNSRPGFGMQILWRPNGWLSVLGNQYALGEEAFGVPGRVRYHSDDSIEIKYYDRPENRLSKMAFSLTGDIGCEHGGGVACIGTRNGHPKQSFLGFMFYNRFWFDRDKYGLTLGGGRINNPGRYLVLLPPINGATAASGTPYFTENPGDPFKAWDSSATFDYMPKQYVTFRWEFTHRATSVPYWSGPGGVTPPVGNTFGAPGALVCLDGSLAPAGGCGAIGLWTPDLKKIENRVTLAILVKF
ncbi:MAG TPA: outer membrane beta-barrel protein [Candidatus Acidoferrum sp.]|nr:outer membrane beta-barrel protein [Candidatus Acidoferrum sp.]